MSAAIAALLSAPVIPKAVDLNMNPLKPSNVISHQVLDRPLAAETGTQTLTGAERQVGLRHGLQL